MARLVALPTRGCGIRGCTRTPVTVQWLTFMDDVVAAYDTTVDPGWRLLPALQTTGSQHPNPVDLADQLATAGCHHPVVLRALREPVDSLETQWVLELHHGQGPGERLGLRLDHCVPSGRGRR